VYPESEMRQEVDFGWLCDRCEAAIKSRGEHLVFIESKDNADKADNNIK